MEGALMQVRDILLGLPAESDAATRIGAVARRCVRDYGGSVMQVGVRAPGITDALKSAAAKARRKLVHVSGWDVRGDDGPQVLLRIRAGRYALAVFDGVDPLAPWLEAAMSGTDGLIYVRGEGDPHVDASIASALAEAWWWDAPLRVAGHPEAWIARGWSNYGVLKDR